MESREKPFQDEYTEGMTTNRVESLTDGVMAIAMTLLVLNFRVPRGVETPAELSRELYDILSSSFFDFVIAFITLASFWVVHHRQFHVIKKVDNGLLWINVISLMFIVMIPFSIILFGNYRQFQEAALFLDINILLIALVKSWQWRYATGNHRLVDADLSERAIVAGRKLNMVTPSVAVLAIAITFISPSNSPMVFLLVPVVIPMARKRLERS